MFGIPEVLVLSNDSFSSVGNITWIDGEHSQQELLRVTRMIMHPNS